MMCVYERHVCLASLFFQRLRPRGVCTANFFFILFAPVHGEAFAFFNLFFSNSGYTEYLLFVTFICRFLNVFSCCKHTSATPGFFSHIFFFLGAANRRSRYGTGKQLGFLFIPSVIGRRVTSFIRMAGIVQWVSRRCLH